MSGRRKRKRTPGIDRGLIAMASIVTNLRASVGQIDDAKEDADITAALRWIYS